MIVTDTTPNDGVLDDDINTIQIVGTTRNSTYVTGTVRASATKSDQRHDPVQPAHRHVRRPSIELNGFTLTDQVSPAVSTPTGVFLYGGVRVLSFNGILQLDTSVTTTPYQIVIGNGNAPLKFAAVDLRQQHSEPGLRQHLDDGSDHARSRRPRVQFIVNGSSRTSTSSRRRRARSSPATSSSSRSWERPDGPPSRRRRSITSTSTAPP